MFDNSEESEEPWQEEEIFSLTENLSTSFVDSSKLLTYYPLETCVGMDNFRQKKRVTTPSKIVPHHAQKLAMSPALLRWKRAAFQVRQIHDPWNEFKIESYEAEVAVRHRYNAIKKEWIKDECTVKIEPKQFANGAMRACFRL
jgi:hypothetical protein